MAIGAKGLSGWVSSDLHKAVWQRQRQRQALRSGICGSPDRPPSTLTLKIQNSKSLSSYALFNKGEAFLKYSKSQTPCISSLSSTVFVILAQELSLFKFPIMMHIVKVYYNRI